MKRKFKQILSMALALMMLIAVIPTADLGMSAHAVDKTADEAINWVKSKVGQALDYDGYYGAQCVDLIMYYYA